MAIPVTYAELSVWHQNVPRSNLGDPSDDPDAVVTDRAIKAVTIDSRASDILDEAKIDLHHPGRGREDEYDLRLGDRVRFLAEVDIGDAGDYGEEYGTLYGGTKRQIEWVGRIQPRNVGRENARKGTISADGTDWVGGVLTERTITGTYVEEDVGAIIRDIIAETASEVDASGVPDLGVTTDAFLQSRDVWDAVISLAARADALLMQDGWQLVVEPITNLTRRFALTAADYNLPVETTTEDRVHNVIRVDSGVSRQLEAADEEQASYETVTATNRLTRRIRARKSQIHSLEIYVQDTDSTDDLNVRLQADEGGAPVAIGDEDSDIVNTSVDSGTLPVTEGWVTAWIPDHTLPDRDPWIIVEAAGSTGQDVSVTSAGELTYRSYYPHPLNFEASDAASIREYGQRELRIERKNLQTLAATRDAVQAELARRAWPMKTIEFEAASPRAHTLEPGDIIAVDIPEVDAVGDFIVVERSHAFDASRNNLQTDITAEWRKGILAPQ